VVPLIPQTPIMQKSKLHRYALLAAFLTCLGSGCSRQTVVEKGLEQVTEDNVPLSHANEDASIAVQLEALPNVLGADWGTIQQPKDKLDLVILKQAGMDTIVLGINVGWNGAMRRFMLQKAAGLPTPNRAFWNGRNSYDPDSVREVLNLVHQQHPTAKIILWIQIDTYPEWITENPDEAVRNDQGDGFVVSYHFQRAGNDPDPSKREVLAWSFYSQKLRDDLRPMIKEFIKTVETAKGGDQVVGYLIGGAQDAQFYLWEGPNSAKAKDAGAWSDYSKPAILAWQQWLKEKYGTPGALSAAWNEPIKSFDQAAPPPAASLIGSPRFHDPVTEVRQRNWKEFIAQGRVTLAEDIARMIHDSASQPVIVGTSSSENGARANMTANVRLMHSKELDFVNGPVRYHLRLPPASPGGALAVTDSFRLNGKPIAFDLDYRTWKNRNYDSRKVGPGYHVSARMVGRAATPEELRAAWLREAGRVVLGGHHVHLNPVEGVETHQVQHEMSVLRNALEQARTPEGAPTGAEVAVIYDERATDYLKGALGDLHMLWSSGQRAELDLSGVPYGFYYVEDFKEGKVPPAKLYIFTNLLEIDDATAAAIEKVKTNNNVLCFLQGTGFNLQKYDASRLSKIVGIDLVPAADASKDSSHATSNPLFLDLPPPAFSIPTEWTAFGPFPQSEAPPEAMIPVAIPARLEREGITRDARAINRENGMLNFTSIGPVTTNDTVWAYARIESPDERDVVIGAGADWWMTWYLNGEKVFDTAGFGNEFPVISSDNFLFPLQLKKGTNILAVRVKAGGRGLRLAVESRNEIEQGNLCGELEGLKLDPQVGLVVQDPKARCLANYPETTFCGFAERKHEGWSSIFAGTHSLRRSTISALARLAGAWSLAPFQYVVAANERFLMIHPQLDGNVLLKLKTPAALTEVNGALPSQAYAAQHLLDLKAYETYFFSLGGEDTLAGSTPGSATIPVPGTLVQFDFRNDSSGKANPKSTRPLIQFPIAEGTRLQNGPGIADDQFDFSGLGAPGPSLFINAAALTSPSEEEAIRLGAWFGFTVAPLAGNSLILDKLDFLVQRTNENSAQNYVVLAKVDGEIQRVGGGKLSAKMGNSNETFTERASIDLGPISSFRNTNSPITFQIFLFGGLADPENPGHTRIDNLILSGRATSE
jgi:hypothetical protein